MPSPQETQARQAVTEALWSYAQDAGKAASIDQILERLKDSAFIGRIKNVMLRDKISNGFCCLGIEGHNFSNAIAWARSIQNADQRIAMLRKIAGYAAVDPAALDKAIEALNWIEKAPLQSEAMYSLSMAQVIQGNEAAAQEISRLAKEPAIRSMIPEIVDFVIQHKGESIDQIQAAAAHNDPGAMRQRLALAFAVRKDVKGIVQSLQGTSNNVLANIISVFARALGWSGLYDEALALINEIPDPVKKHTQQGYLATHVAFPASIVEPILVQLSEIKDLSLTPSMFIFEKAFSGRMADAMSLLHKLTNQNAQSTIFYQLVDDLYTLSTVA